MSSASERRLKAAERVTARHDADWRFVRRLMQVAAVAAGLAIVWQLTFILLLVFAAVLVAVLLTGASSHVTRLTPLTPPLALAAVLLGLALMIGGLGTFFGTALAAQLNHVFESGPGALDAAGTWLGIPHASDRLTDALTSAGLRNVSQAAIAGYAVVSGAGQLLLVLIGGIYLASSPQVYRDGLAKLFPAAMQHRLIETMNTVASALRLWFTGQCLSMLLVGVLSSAAFWLIGLPIPLGLGAIAGATNFIPLFGPMLGSLPAVLFAFTIDIGTVAWTLGAVFVIQQIDGYLGMPLIQRQVVALPPALLLFSLVALGTLFGWPGIFLAAPLTVAGMVLVQKLWVRGLMGERVKVVGERTDKSSNAAAHG